MFFFFPVLAANPGRAETTTSIARRRGFAHMPRMARVVRRCVRRHQFPVCVIIAVYIAGYTLNQVLSRYSSGWCTRSTPGSPTIVAFLLIGVPTDLLTGIVRGAMWTIHRLRGTPAPVNCRAVDSWPAPQQLSRRCFMASPSRASTAA